MDIKKLLTEKDLQRQKSNFISFSPEELSAIRPQEVKHIIEFFHGYTLMQLPKSEIDFFKWLKETEPAVWDDLWGDNVDIYLVSIDFLRTLAGENPHFHICDLIEADNYWFCKRHIKPKGMKELEDIILKIEAGQKLSASDVFLFQLSQNPLDIWHFCYEHNINITKMKTLISDMVYNGFLVHLPSRDDLIKYIED